MKPNLYIVLVGNPGIGKGEIAKQIEQILQKDGQNVAVSPELSNTFSLAFLEKYNIDVHVVCTTPTMIKKNNVWKMLGM